MLARLQRTWVVLLLVLAGATGLWSVAKGVEWWVAALIFLALMHLHAFVLALEFVALARIDPGGNLPRPDAWTLIRAWWGEIWTGFQVFGWRQPFRSQAVPDAPPSGDEQTRRPVLLVHGFVCNRGMWNPWMQQFLRARVPYVAVNLEPVFGSIEAYVQVIESAIQRLEAGSPHKPLIVAHSMGGLATRAWMVGKDGSSRIHGVVTIGSPHSGTLVARFGISHNVRQMRRGSDWLNALHAAETATMRDKFICYYSHCDNIVMPASTATLPGADNRHVPGVAHVHLAYQPQVLQAVMTRTIVGSGDVPAEAAIDLLAR